MAKKTSVVYKTLDSESVFVIGIYFVDWWHQYSADEWNEQVRMYKRGIKQPEVKMPTFLSNALLPVLKEEYQASFKLIERHWNSAVFLSNGKALRTLLAASVLGDMRNLADVIGNMLTLNSKLFERTHLKEFDIFGNGTVDATIWQKTFKAIAIKGQCAVDSRWNNKNGKREVFMPDGCSITVSTDFTSDKYQKTPIDDVIAEHYEKMMMNFDLAGITEDTDPTTLSLSLQN